MKNNVSNLISIIIPSYNIAPYLPRCLDSLLQQTNKNLEIIIVDDGSTDDTGIIADDYSRRYPKLIQCLHQINKGVTYARIAGIEASHGEWIGFVDGDDEVEADMYERLLNNAIKYDADISHCGYQTIVGDGERIHYFYNSGRLVIQDRLTGLKDLLEGEIVEPGLWNKIYKRTLLESDVIDQIDKSIRFNEDLMMNYLLFSKSRCSVFEDFCPYHYYVRQTSATRSEFKPHRALDPVLVRGAIAKSIEPELADIAWKKYILSCAYARLSFYEEKGYNSEKKELKSLILSEYRKWKLFDRKELIKILSAVFFPKAYNYAYKIRLKYFKSKIYE